MVTVSYHAKQQMERLSLPERRDLERVLAGGVPQAQTTERDTSGRFVSRFGDGKRVVWSKDEGGNIVVLTVVAR